MKKLVTAMLSICALGLSLNQSAHAEDSPLSVDASVGVYSDYLFRGLMAYKGDSIQSSLGANYLLGDSGTLTASIWNHTPGNNSEKSTTYDEYDYTISYTKAFEEGSLSVGNVWYTYANDHTGALANSKEVYISGSLDAPLKPMLSAFWDYDATKATYYELSFSDDLTGGILKENTISPYVAFGFGANSKSLYGQNGLEHVTFGINTQSDLGIFKLSPGVNYTMGIADAAVKDLWLGLKLSTSF